MRLYLEDTQSYINFCLKDRLWTENLRTIADLAAEKTFIFTDRYEMERCTRPVHFSGAIDWNHIPFGDPEWCFAFSRHTFLLNLAKAYAATGVERYRKAWIDLFGDFADRTAPEGENRKLCWRSLEAGIRIENWIRSIEFFEDSNPLPQSTLAKLESLLDAHIEYLVEAHNDFHRLSNWGVLQDHGLLLASVYRDRDDTALLALERLAQEMELQTMEDGMHWEQSTMYQAEVLHAALDSILIASRAKLYIPPILEEKTHLLAKGLAASVRPDGRCYLFGDSDEVDVRDLILKAAVLFDDSHLAWMGRGGNDTEFYASFPIDLEMPEMDAQKDRSKYFPATGNAILALSRESEVRFHCGLYGSGHGHFDQLHFDLYNRGQVILTDSGRYTYTDSEERYRLKGSRGHNTIIIDGEEMAVMDDSWIVHDFAEPLFHSASVDGPYKFVSASHKGYLKKCGVLVTRSILTLGEDLVLIFDEAEGKGEHEAEILFHIVDGAIVSEDDGYRIAKGAADATLILLNAEDWNIGPSVISKRYNELLPSQLVTTKYSFTDQMLAVHLIAIGSRRPEVEFLPVTKPLSGEVFDPDDAIGFLIKRGADSYTVSFARTELPHDGFLTSCGKAEAYARVFVKKNDDDTVIVKR